MQGIGVLDPRAANVLAMAGLAQGLGKQFKEDRFDRSYNDYYKGFQADPDYKPDINADGYDAKAYNKASVDFVKHQLDTEDLKAKRFENVKKDIDEKHSALLEIGRNAESIATTNPDAAVARYMDGYTKHPNGIDVAHNPETGKWDFQDHATGATWSEQVSLDTARQMFQSVIKKEDYAQMYLTDRSKVIKHNENAFLNPTVLVASDNTELYLSKPIDPNTGEVKSVYRDKSGQVINMTEEDLMKGGYRLKDNVTKEKKEGLGLEKLEHETEEAKAKAANEQGLFAQQEKIQKLENQGRADATGGSMEKQIDTVMSAYNVDRATAMDLIRQDKTYGSRLTAAQKAIDEAGLAFDDPDDAVEIKKILEDWNVDKIPGKEGYGKPPTKQPAAKSGPPAANTPSALYLQLRKQGVDAKEAEKQVKKAFPNMPKKK